MIEILTEAHREESSRILAKEFGGPLIVTNGRLMDAATHPGFVWVEDGRVAGLITYRLEGEDCEVSALVSYGENRGVGSALLERVREVASAEGCRRLFLITTNDNARAIGFYQKRGMELVAVRLGEMERSRILKPQIPLTGIDDIPLLHELEFAYWLSSRPTRRGGAGCL
jgi:ribosomal protein S18 acetylase RimI-like enzyme